MRNAKELSDIGFQAWVPLIEREYRKARSKKFIRVAESLLPSFIFVLAGNNPGQCAERLDDLRHQLGIRVMREKGKYCATSAESLEGLRAVEREAETFGVDNLLKEDNFVIGQDGTINSMAFMGLTGKLVGRSGRNLIVLLNNAAWPIKIRPSMFCPL